MKKSIKVNYIYNMLYQLLVIILPIITTPYLARVLHAKGNGIYGYTYSILTYFLLFGNLGITLYGSREIAYSQSDIKKRSNIFYELLIIRTVTMISAMIVYYFSFASHGTYSFIYKIFLFEMVGNLLDISWFYQGIEDFKKIAIRNFIIKIISLTLVLTLVKSYSDLWKYTLINSLSILLGSLSLWLGIKKYIGKPGKLNFKRHIKFMIILFIPQVATQIYTVLDKTMIGKMLVDMDEVGYYDQSQKVSRILLTVITSLGTVMVPRMASNYDKKDFDKLLYYMNKAIGFVWMLGCAITFGLIAVAPEFVPLFFGKGYDKVVPLLYVFSFIILAIGINNVLGIQYLIPTKKEKEYTISVVAAAVFNLVLNIILIKCIGTIGAAIASVAAEILIIFIQLFFIRKDFKVGFVFKKGIKYIFMGLIMLVIIKYTGSLFNNILYSLIIKVISGMVVYSLMLFITKDELIIDNVFPFLSKIKKKLLRGK